MGLWVVFPAYGVSKIVAKLMGAAGKVISRTVFCAASVAVAIAPGTRTSKTRNTGLPWEVVTAIMGPSGARNGGLPTADADKKNMFLFCRHHEQQTDLNTDPEVIRSSPVVSHWGFDDLGPSVVTEERGGKDGIRVGNLRRVKGRVGAAILWRPGARSHQA